MIAAEPMTMNEKKTVTTRISPDSQEIHVVAAASGDRGVVSPPAAAPTTPEQSRKTAAPVDKKENQRDLDGEIPAPADASKEAVALDVASLCAWYDRQLALDHIVLKAQARVVTALIGPSGCGKSTFLRCLNRMHELIPKARLEGTIRLFGEDLYSAEFDPSMVRRRVGMVFQKSNPFPTMSIAENVTVGLRLNGIRDRSALEQQMEKALRMAALWDEVKDRLNQPGISLSGGQQQRLCIARALAVEPEVLLMDEPASALDPIATMKIEELIQELKKEYTVVIVTHNMQQAARVSDYTAFFYMGRLIEFDTTNKIFTNPTNKQTEDYITGRFG